MVVTDAPNVKDCVILGPGSALLFFGHHQEPREGLYLHEAQELAEIMMKTTTWMGQPAHQQVFPIMIVEGRQAISMSRAVSEHRDLQFPTETLQGIGGKHRSRVAGLMRMEAPILHPPLWRSWEGGGDVLEASAGYGHPCPTSQG